MKYGYVYWIHLPKHTINQGYIGITVLNPTKRWSKHKSDIATGKHCNPILERAYNKYKDKLIWEVIFEGPYEGCLQLETYWRPLEKIGWNISIGGNAPWIGKKHTEKTKQKIGQAQMGEKNHMYSKKLTLEQREKISKATKGANNPRARKVQCIDTGIIYNTAKEAAENYNLKTSANLIKACKNKQKTCGGVHWKYIK